MIVKLVQKTAIYAMLSRVINKAFKQKKIRFNKLYYIITKLNSCIISKVNTTWYMYMY